MVQLDLVKEKLAMEPVSHWIMTLDLVKETLATDFVSHWMMTLDLVKVMLGKECVTLNDAYNTVSIYCTHIPIPAKPPPENVTFSLENAAGKSKNFFSAAKLKTHLPILHKNQNLVISTNQLKRAMKNEIPFEVRVMEFFNSNSSHLKCKYRFFMTWISSVESFGDREVFCMYSLFKAHPKGCLIIVSNSLDSINGVQILRPFWEKGFKVTLIAPDFNYLFKGTPAEGWYNQLMQGNVHPGVVPFGQNLSNLLRLGLLYRFGGIYLDTDVVVLKSFGKLRNSIGAQTIDLGTGNWSRLNNAVMIFDKNHPLLYKFIQEFALTFDGNKWGHNGPYLVSRVVKRVSGRPGYNFTVLSPMAFYPVDWSRIGSLFEGPKSLNHSKWLIAKLKQIRSTSFAVHLWNKESRGIEIEKGSIIQHIIV
ncbi:hypothetical protein BUALT_Bualt18G0109100 [Buddleja alternifolia]|uniref:Alpha 1,4-glycosyltransferase domain-containing protein n=1 Tax=Buddleja alternifolia TaxID=168488 RepID=A0AAV6W9U2_9LAMI|nr:hypothetical protein BUALT_Bualt18G0109100 [Buddleja alternifolia]